MSKTKSSTSLPKSPQTLYLIDISSFIFRAFFAIRSLKNKTGEPTNAVYGVATMLARLADEAKPNYLAVVYDSKSSSFRKEIFPEYKANRSEAPDDLVPQFARIEALIRGFEIHSYREEGQEADDLIATLTKKWCKAAPENRVVVVSGDKDLMQLVDSQVVLWDTMSNKVYGAPEVEEKFLVKPEQIRDYLALVGDSSDNIPGVRGIGPKSASELLQQFQDLESILGAAKEGKIPGKKGVTLCEQEGNARLSARLATVREDLNLETPLSELEYHFHLTKEGIQLLRDLDFHSLITRWQTQFPKRLIGAPNVTAGQIESGQSNSSLVSGTSSESPSESLGQMELSGVPQEGQAQSQNPTQAPVPAIEFRTISTESQFEDLLSHLKNQKEFGIDLETTSLNPREAQIVGVAICTKSTSMNHPEAVYIPLGHDDSSVPQLPRGQVLERLKLFLENPDLRKIGQNLKYDLSVLAVHGIECRGSTIDTMIAAYLLDPDGRHNLQTLALKYLNYTVQTYEQVCGKGKAQIPFSQVSIADATRYSAEDAWVAVRLWQELEPQLEEERLLEIFSHIDLPMVRLLEKIELQGVCLDQDWLKKLSLDFDLELKQITEKVQGFAKEPVNLNSPKQLAALLFEELKLPTQGKTKTGFSTDAQVLEELAPLHEVPQLLLEYREISKLKGTYVDPLPLLVDSKTGKIHASFHQTIAATGRLSSSNPNLQNIPIRSDRGMKIRRAFVPSPGCLLLSADYSQIELRLLAHMSGDSELTSSFRNEEDVHRRTASEIFSVSQEAVEERQREIAKAINFGLMYGKTAFGLAQELKISRKEAQTTIDRYFERYSGVKEFLESQVALAKENGYVTTLLGRKRWLPDIRSKNPVMRNNAERMAMNSPIQGTAADLMKLAMIQIDERIRLGGFKSRMIIQVHDEVVLDCPKSEIEDVKKEVVEAMESAMSFSVPLRVNSSTGENWMELF